MKKAENSEKRPEIWRQVFWRMKNQDGARPMAALLFFCVLRGGRVDHSGVRFRVGWKDPPPPEGGPEEVCGGLGGGISAG